MLQKFGYVKVKKKVKVEKFQKNNRKKHVETMFITNKQKNYPYYFKFTNIQNLKEFNLNKYFLQKNTFYIRCLSSGYMTLDPLKAIIRLFKFFLKNYKLEDSLKYKLFVFPDFVLTSKPKEVRMGGGKGANFKKVAIIKGGQNIISLTCFSRHNNLILLLLKKMAYKLPFNSTIVLNSW